MGTEIIKYHNDMNKVSFSGFKEKELDLFFSICQKMKDRGSNEVIFSFSDLRKISQYSNRSIERFYSDLDRVYKKMLELNLKYEDEKELRRFVLFSRYIIKKEEQLIIIKASEDFEYILNKLIGTFTKFDLVDFVSLKSIYSKNMFKLLKQWDSTRQIKFEIIELKNILGVPIKYTTSNFNDRVLKPIMEELPHYFSSLKLEKIKTGRKITHLKFTWSNKKEKIKEAELIEIAISEKINNAIDKARKNRFIAKLLSDDNIKVLVEKFDEKDLIKGLLWAYKEIKKDISSLNYLIKSIKTGAEETEKKVVIKKEKIIHKEKQLKIDKIVTEDLGEVSEKELEEARNLYLEKTNTKSFTGVHEKIFNSTKGNYIKEVREIESSKENIKEPTILDIKEKFKLEENGQSRTEYLKQLKELEFNLILSKDNRLEKFKAEFQIFLQLEDMLANDSKFIDRSIIEKVNEELKKLETYFDTFLKKSEETKILELIDIPEDRLLSKKGKPLFGGALVSRLEVVAKELKKKIRYKDKIIG